MHSCLLICGLILLKLMVEEAKLKVKVNTKRYILKHPVIIKQLQTVRFRRLGLGHAIATIRSVPISVYIKDQ